MVLSARRLECLRLGTADLLRSVLRRRPDLPPGQLRSSGPVGAGPAGGLRRAGPLRPGRPSAGARRRRTTTRSAPDLHPRRPGRRHGRLHREGRLPPSPRRDRPDELDALRADVDDAVGRARPDDRRSWWTTVDGVDICNRVNYINDQSALVAGLGADERFRRIGAFGGPDLRDAADRLDGNGVVIKVPGARSGLADLPWHRDCGMGATRSSAPCSTSAFSSTRPPPVPVSSRCWPARTGAPPGSRPRRDRGPPRGGPHHRAGGRHRALRPHPPRRPSAVRPQGTRDVGPSTCPTSHLSPSRWSGPARATTTSCSPATPGTSSTSTAFR